MRRVVGVAVTLTGAFFGLVALASALGALAPPGVFALDSLDCEPPCWQGIVPGETNASAARRALSSSALVEPGSVRYNVPSIDYEDTGDLYWSLRDESAGLLRGASARVRGWVLTAFDVPGLGARLGDLVAVFGEPTWVVARYLPGQEPARLVVDALYPALGMRLVLSGEGYVHLSPELVVSRVYYGDQTRLPEPAAEAGLSLAMTWRGFVSVGRYGVLPP